MTNKNDLLEITAAESSIEQAKENYINALYGCIDAIINLEDFIPIPNQLKDALSKVNSLKHYAELELEPGDKVWDNHNNEYGIIKSIGDLNIFFEGDKMSVGKKFCIQTGF